MAGYEENMNVMLNTNQGLRSRFRKVWTFPDWTVEDCVGFCLKQATKDNMPWEVDGPVHKALFNGFQQLMSYEAVDTDTQRTVRHPRPMARRIL